MGEKKHAASVIPAAAPLQIHFHFRGGKKKMAERHAETRRDRNYKVSKISNSRDMSKKRSGLIHTIRRLNIAEAICLRQKGRRDVTRIPLLI